MNQISVAERMQKRRLVVETFGSKKRKQAMKAADSNRLDVTGQESIDVVKRELAQTASQDIDVAAGGSSLGWLTMEQIACCNRFILTDSSG